MFLRIWCLCICKLGLLCIALLALGQFVFNTEPWTTLGTVASALLVLLGISGAISGIWFFVLKKPVACPLCSTIGNLVHLSQYDVGLECQTCGLVHVNTPTGFRFKVAPLGSIEE